MLHSNAPLVAAAFLLSACATQLTPESSLTLRDESRRRDVPVHLYRSNTAIACKTRRACPVAIFSPGTGMPNTAYSFLNDTLAQAGYLVVAVQHELPSDAAMPNTGDLIKDRSPTWARGVANLRFVRDELSKRFPGYSWNRPVVIGHSTGGDISALWLTQSPGLASALVTLDQRRVALPRDASLRLLSLRGSDFSADPGVLPSAEEQAALGYCIVNLHHANHDDMNDDGPAELKTRLMESVIRFLDHGECEA